MAKRTISAVIAMQKLTMLSVLLRCAMGAADGTGTLRIAAPQNGQLGAPLSS